MNINCGIETGLSAQDERSISAVLIAYASAIDSRDWALFRNCFTADCQADYGEFGSWQNIADLTDYMREAHARLGPTLHRISNIKLTNAQSGANATQSKAMQSKGKRNAKQRRKSSSWLGCICPRLDVFVSICFGYARDVCSCMVVRHWPGLAGLSVAVRACLWLSVPHICMESSVP